MAVGRPDTGRLRIGKGRLQAQAARGCAILYVALAVAAGLGTMQAAAQPVVTTLQGRLRGVSLSGVIRYADVPYARPPVGGLRWRPPQPPQRWSGVRDASRFGPICMQTITADNGVGPGPASEDCLSLNVYAPVGARRLPVMVWIHGGGFVNGSGSAALYDGSALARQGVVVVTLNYRLGRFGFFAHPALTAEAQGAPVANYGLMDQIAALRWVKANIAGFGGDPCAVTIFGESAGGASVNRLMMIDQARGLFRRAIVESGLGAESGQTLKQAEADGEAFAARLGVSGADASALRALPAQAILDAGPIELAKGEAPIIDGVLLREDPLEAFAAGHEAAAPYLAGSNGLEVPAAWAAGFRGQASFTPAQVQALQAAYGSPAAYDARVLTDAIFAAPARALVAAHAAHGAPSFLYRFSVAPPAEMRLYGGAIHASERPYVFETLAAATWPTGSDDAVQARELSAYWVAFAKTGDPNGGGRPSWPAYGAGDRLLHFTGAGPVAQATPDARVLDLISQDQAAAARRRAHLP